MCYIKTIICFQLITTALDIEHNYFLSGSHNRINLATISQEFPWVINFGSRSYFYPEAKEDCYELKKTCMNSIITALVLWLWNKDFLRWHSVRNAVTGVKLTCLQVTAQIVRLIYGIVNICINIYCMNISNMVWEQTEIDDIFYVTFLLACV